MPEREIPREGGFDHSLDLLSEGYDFIPNRCRRFGSDLFETRLMLSKAVCISGPEAAEVFYGGDRFTRRGAMPPSTLRLLQDKGSVQQLDGPAHRHRKALFISILDDEGQVERLRQAFADAWRERVGTWAERTQIVLFDEVYRVLAVAACRWTGVPIEKRGAERVARELSAMIENAGGLGPRMWRALWLRAWHERFVRNVIAQIRSGDLRLPPEAPARIVAEHRDPEGRWLDLATAAVELVNLLRPTAAITRFIVFAAMALERHPEWRTAFAAGDETQLEGFVEEVRRLAPFFPAIGGRVRTPFDWRGRHFGKGEWVLLDLYGTNRDARSFADPDRFGPERAPSWREQSYRFVPQGGGDMHETHRCPGERVTVELMKEAVRQLTRGMNYEVPPQNLAVSLAEMPARPASGFVIDKVRPG